MKEKSLLFYALLLMLICSCEQRFSYLSKVRAARKRGVVRLELQNRSPQYLPISFEEEVKNYMHKRLEAEGYKCSETNAQYLLEVEMGVDSSLNRGFAFAGPGPGGYAYSRRSLGIMLNLQLKPIKSEAPVWTNAYDLYFFNDYKRDLHRTKGVIKYLLSSLNQD